MLFALVQRVYRARFCSRPLTALYGGAEEGFVCRSVQVCALFAPNKGLHFQTLHASSSLLICYLHWCNVFNGLGLPANLREFPLTALSLVSRPHPAHARRRGLVSQVQILGLAPETWSGQSYCRTAFIGIMRKRELLQSYRSK